VVSSYSKSRLVPSIMSRHVDQVQFLNLPTTIEPRIPVQ
jgi:hypothetical protein